MGVEWLGCMVPVYFNCLRICKPFSKVFVSFQISTCHKWIPVAPYFPTLVAANHFNFSHFNEWRGITVILISISLMANVENPFLSFLAMSHLSWTICLSLLPFFIGLFAFLCFGCKFAYIFRIQIFCHISIPNILSHSVSCLFIFLAVP